MLILQLENQRIVLEEQFIVILSRLKRLVDEAYINLHLVSSGSCCVFGACEQGDKHAASLSSFFLCLNCISLTRIESVVLVTEVGLFDS